MRVFAKILLLVSLAALTVLVLLIVGRRGDLDKVGPRTNPFAALPAPATAQSPSAAASQGESSTVGNLLAPFERFGAAQPPATTPAAPPVRQEPHDLESSAQDEGLAVARRSEEPVFGADPPGPTLRPSEAEGTVVTTRWLTGPQEASGKNVYVVQQGDTLYGIAVAHYGDAKYVSLIEAANPGLSARNLKIGARLGLPDAAPSDTAAASGSAPAPKEEKVYIVARGDTLVGIARRFYGDASKYRAIYEANRDVLSSPSATLNVGQRLRLPEAP